MLRALRFLTFAGLVLQAGWSQQSYPFFSPSPAPPLLVTATANSPFGQSSYCYWVVVVYPIGKSTPSAPSCLSNAIETSSVLISWSGAQGASSYDVLRTTTAILPNVTSSIAVATAVSGTTQTDSFGALSSYTISSALPATANLYLDNTAFSTPQLRAVITGVGGTTAFNLGAGGGGGTPGGSSGQVQYNNSGSFGGFTVSGDATLNTGTGVLTVGNGAITNAKLANSATTVNGQTCTLGSTCNANAGAAAHSVALNEGAGAAFAAATIGTSGRILIDQGPGADPSFNTVSGDATLTNAGVVTVTQVNGAAVPASAKLTSTNAGRQIVAAAAETAPITVSATGGIACGTCATTTNGGALSATSPVTISAAGLIACSTCATTTNGGSLSGTSPVTISAAGVIACATCATTTNGGALSGTVPITVSAAGAIGVNISANLQVTGSNLDTIQGIQTTSTPQFTRLGLGQAADATASLAATQNGLAATSTDGYILQNTTAATTGTKQQFSPRVRWLGNLWTGAVSQTAEWFTDEENFNAGSSDFMLAFTPKLNGTAASAYAFCRSGGSAKTFLIGMDGSTPTSCTSGAGFGAVGSTNVFSVVEGGNSIENFNTNGMLYGSGKLVMWSANADPSNGTTGDTGECRVSAALMGINDGSATCTNFRDLKLRTPNFTGVPALWNNVTTAGMGATAIYAAVATTGQTASIGTTNLQCGAAVCAAGVYRVTVYDVITTTGTGTLTSTVGYNDGTAARTQTSAGVSTTATNFEQVSYVLKADGVNNITYATTESNTGTYSIFVDLERLQ